MDTTAEILLPGLPEWAHSRVAKEAARLYTAKLQPNQRAIVHRLITDKRMRHVWKELSSRSRVTGEFVHCGRPPYGIQHPLSATPEQVQADAIAQVLVFTFRVVVHPRYFEVLKPSDITKMRKRLVAEASMLRRLANTGSADDAALRRVAEQRERVAADLPTLDHPRVIQNDRGDRTARGVQIRIAELLKEHFGERLDGTAATLTAVALGAGRRSGRVSRSAFSKAKRAAKSRGKSLI